MTLAELVAVVRAQSDRRWAFQLLCDGLEELMSNENYRAAWLLERKAWADYVDSVGADYRLDRHRRGHPSSGANEVAASPETRSAGARWQAAYRERNRLAPWACAR